ncbi:MAG: enoyl-ACP reductase [Deltaproteobacteria bacterium]|nr:enoyl-ACP reductase [Deltaproteobacteria bacterium]
MNGSGKLKGKKALIVAVANERSIAWGIAQALHREGCELAFTYLGEALERRVRPLAESVGAKVIAPCDVRDESQVEALFHAVGDAYGSLDFLVHSIAYAERSDLEGSFVATSKNGFLTALEVSAYSLVSLTRKALPLMEKAGGGSIVTLSYYGAEKVVPNYNVMGVAKAALECCVRYLAWELGPKNIRVNAISAGPVRTLAAAGIRGFKTMMQTVQERAPLKRNVTLDEISDTGLFLLSPSGGGITGETLYVDSGYNILGM